MHLFFLVYWLVDVEHRRLVDTLIAVQQHDGIVISCLSAATLQIVQTNFAIHLQGVLEMLGLPPLIRYRAMLALPFTNVRLKQGGLFSNPEIRVGNDRLVAQPTGKGYAPTGTVLGRDIASGVQVRIEMIPTLPTLECALGTPVGAGSMPTAATQLRGMSRINRNHRTTALLGLVLNFGFERGERPAMHPAFRPSLLGGFLALFCPLADVFQVFQHDRRTRAGGLHDLLTEDVIGIFSEACPTSFELPQVPFGGAAALLLQRADLLEVAALDGFPASLAKKLVVGCDRWPIDA